MDEQTALVLSLQLVALCCIAVGLLLYLVCRMRGGGARGGVARGTCPSAPDAGLAVLVTSADTALGLQCALRLSQIGFRVFAGVRPQQEDYDGRSKVVVALTSDEEDDEVFISESPEAAGNNTSTETESPTGEEASKAPSRSVSRSSSSAGRMSVTTILRAAAKAREAAGVGRLITIPLDVTREDLLHDALDLVRAHLPAGEDGLWAVVNTAGSCCRGRLDAQEASQWESLLRVNVVGALKTARAFLPLLRHAKGRLVTVGACPPAPGLAAFTAARYAVEGASAALRREMAPHGVSVVTLRPCGGGVPAELLFAAPGTPRINQNETIVQMHQECDFSVLTPHAMRIVEEAITSPTPKESYQLMSQNRYPTWDELLFKLKTKFSFEHRKSQIM